MESILFEFGVWTNENSPGRSAKYIVSGDGRTGLFDIRPYLEPEAFQPLHDLDGFMNIRNGKYFVEWGCGAELSVDSIEARWVTSTVVPR